VANDRAAAGTLHDAEYAAYGFPAHLVRHLVARTELTSRVSRIDPAHVPG